MEHSNRFVKQAIKNLGPNANERSITRICKAENNTGSLITFLNQSLHCNPGSGRHTSSSTDKDLHKLVERAAATEIFEKHSYCIYKDYLNFERDYLKGLDMSRMHKWINGHKKNVLLGIKAC